MEEDSLQALGMARCAAQPLPDQVQVSPEELDPEPACQQEDQNLLDLTKLPQKSSSEPLGPS